MGEEKKKLKMALIVGASHALKFKIENPHASDADIIQQVSKESNDILSKLNN